MAEQSSWSSLYGVMKLDLETMKLDLETTQKLLFDLKFSMADSYRDIQQGIENSTQEMKQSFARILELLQEEIEASESLDVDVSESYTEEITTSPLQEEVDSFESANVVLAMSSEISPHLQRTEECSDSLHGVSELLQISSLTQDVFFSFAKQNMLTLICETQTHLSCVRRNVPMQSLSLKPPSWTHGAVAHPPPPPEPPDWSCCIDAAMFFADNCAQAKFSELANIKGDYYGVYLTWANSYILVADILFNFIFAHNGDFLGFASGFTLVSLGLAKLVVNVLIGNHPMEPMIQNGAIINDCGGCHGSSNTVISVAQFGVEGDTLSLLIYARSCFCFSMESKSILQCFPFPLDVQHGMLFQLDIVSTPLVLQENNSLYKINAFQDTTSLYLQRFLPEWYSKILDVGQLLSSKPRAIHAYPKFWSLDGNVFHDLMIINELIPWNQKIKEHGARDYFPNSDVQHFVGTGMTNSEYNDDNVIEWHVACVWKIAWSISFAQSQVSLHVHSLQIKQWDPGGWSFVHGDCTLKLESIGTLGFQDSKSFITKLLEELQFHIPDATFDHMEGPFDLRKLRIFQLLITIIMTLCYFNLEDKVDFKGEGNVMNLSSRTSPKKSKSAQGPQGRVLAIYERK